MKWINAEQHGWLQTRTITLEVTVAIYDEEHEEHLDKMKNIADGAEVITEAIGNDQR